MHQNRNVKFSRKENMFFTIIFFCRFVLLAQSPTFMKKLIWGLFNHHWSCQMDGMQIDGIEIWINWALDSYSKRQTLKLCKYDSIDNLKLVISLKVVHWPLVYAIITMNPPFVDLGKPWEICTTPLLCRFFTMNYPWRTHWMVEIVILKLHIDTKW